MKAGQGLKSLPNPLTVVCLTFASPGAPALAQVLDDTQVARFSKGVVTSSADHATALQQLIERANPDVAAARL